MRVPDREAIILKLQELLIQAKLLDDVPIDETNEDLVYDIDNIEDDIHATLLDLSKLIEEYSETICSTPEGS